MTIAYDVQSFLPTVYNTILQLAADYNVDGHVSSKMQPFGSARHANPDTVYDKHLATNSK